MQADHVPVQHFFESDGAALGQRVVFGGHQHQVVGAVGAGLQAVGVGLAHVADADVGRAFMHGLQHVGRQVLLQINLDLAVLPGKAAQVFRQKLHDGGNGGVHAHVAAHAVGVFRELALHALQPIEHVAGVVQQALARGG